MTHLARNQSNLRMSRRSFVAGLTALSASTVVGTTGSAWAHSDLPQTRDLAFKSLHTGETLHVGYVEKGRLRTDAVSAINHILRDWRTGDVYNMDIQLLDVLFALRQRIGSNQRFNIISGYRSPATNGKLAANSNGVAKRSLHMRGMAIDVSLDGTKLHHLHQEAVAMRAGGVGLYSGSGFVHLDTGRPRSWGA